METPQISTQRLDHLGIEAGICHEIELAEQIDQRVSKTKGKVSVGQAARRGKGQPNLPSHDPEIH